MEFAILRDCWDTSLASRETASKKELSWHQGAARLPAIFQAVLSVSLVAPLLLGAGQITFLTATEAWPAATGVEGSMSLSPSFVIQAGRTEQERQLLGFPGRARGLHSRLYALSRRSRSLLSG